MQTLQNILIATFVCAFFVPAISFAEEDVWFYRFHLEWKNGALAKNTEVQYFYDVAPYGPDALLDAGQYYAEIKSGKGASLTRVWFNEPTLVVAGKNRKILELMVPYFANANTVTFYTKEGVQQFTESVSGASFCDEDSVCEKEVGENYTNCALDCPAPIGVPTTPSPADTKDPLPLAPEAEPSSAPVVSGSQDTTTVSREQSPSTASPVIPLTIGVGLILVAILGLVYRKRMQS